MIPTQLHRCTFVVAALTAAVATSGCELFVGDLPPARGDAAGGNTTGGGAGAPGSGGAPGAGGVGGTGVQGSGGAPVGGTGGMGAPGGMGVGGSAGGASGTGGDTAGVGGSSGGGASGDGGGAGADAAGNGGDTGAAGTAGASSGAAGDTSQGGTGGQSSAAGTGGGPLDCATDKDLDTHKISAPTCPAANDDCDDSDASVHPGQSIYFAVPAKGGGFDYDCDGNETTELGVVSFDCTKLLPTDCVGAKGYANATVSCGVPANVVTCKLAVTCVDGSVVSAPVKCR